jgi:threonine 3-dehydrogenase
MKEGFDVALEMSGSPKAMTDLLPAMFHGGKIALLGIMPGSAAIDWNLVVFNQLTIKGIYGREMYETWYKMTAMIQSGLDISPVITHRFPYTQFKEAIELMKSGNSGKIVLEWSQLSS